MFILAQYNAVRLTGTNDAKVNKQNLKLAIAFLLHNSFNRLILELSYKSMFAILILAISNQGHLSIMITACYIVCL